MTTSKFVDTNNEILSFMIFCLWRYLFLCLCNNDCCHINDEKKKCSKKVIIWNVNWFKYYIWVKIFSNLPKFLDRLRFSKKFLETFMGIYNDFLISAKILDSRFFTRFCTFSKYVCIHKYSHNILLILVCSTLQTLTGLKNTRTPVNMMSINLVNPIKHILCYICMYIVKIVIFICRHRLKKKHNLIEQYS